MNYINYRIHLLLQSKYKLLINLFILFLIYITFYNQNISYCMVEDNLEIERKAEFSIVTQVVQPQKHKNSLIYEAIEEFLNPMQIVKEKEEIIQKQIKMLNKKSLQIRELEHELLYSGDETIQWENVKLKRELDENRNKVNKLVQQVWRFSNRFQALDEQENLILQKQRDVYSLVDAANKLTGTVQQELQNLRSREAIFEELKFNFKCEKEDFEISQNQFIKEKNRLMDSISDINMTYMEYDILRENSHLPNIHLEYLEFEHRTNKRLLRIMQHLKEDVSCHFTTQSKKELVRRYSLPFNFKFK